MTAVGCGRKMKITLLHKFRYITRINDNCKLCGTIINRSNHTASETKPVEVGLENPIIVLPEHNRLDMITLSHVIGNVRPNLVNKQLLTKTPLSIRLCEVENLRLRCSSENESSQSVILETPLTVLPEKQGADMIGPPNSLSKLRPIIRFQTVNETPLQRKLRKLQDETQEWNEKFWSKHNLKFKNERDSFVKLRLKGDEERTTLTSEEMSEFYKAFLDRNWKSHVEYNFQWYKQGSKLVGSFQYDFKHEHLDWFSTYLPASADNIKFYDTIGNNSNSQVLDMNKYKTFKFKTRYPLLSGWKTFYILKYCVPTYEYLFHDQNELFSLKMRAVDHIVDDVIIRDAVVKVLLPQFSDVINVELPHGYSKFQIEKSYTALIQYGRPTVVFNASNLLENHIENFNIKYKFSSYYLLYTPATLMIYIKAIFVIFIVILRY